MKINHTDLEGLLREDLETCNKEQDLIQIKSKYIGKKGFLTKLFSSLKEIEPENRKNFGAKLNQVKITITQIIEKKLIEIKSIDNKTKKHDLDIPPRTITLDLIILSL